MKRKPTTDPVVHPPHYAALSPEPIDVIESWVLGFHLGSAVQYIARAGRKEGNPEVSDLRKSIWYISRRITALEKAAARERKAGAA